MFTGDFFITPHAVRQFQSRIAPRLTYEQALGAIIRGLRDAKNFHLTANGKARYVRAVIKEGEESAQPAVITILRSGRGKKLYLRVEPATGSLAEKTVP